MPIRKGDGTGIASIRKGDGTGITEVRKGDGTVLFSTGGGTPDSVISQFDAQELTGFSDGDTVSTWTDQVGTNDATGSGTYRTNGINGYASVEFDGVNDGFVSNTGTITQPFTVIFVIDPFFADDAIYAFQGSNNGIGSGPLTQWNNNIPAWNAYAGSGLVGSNTLDRSIITVKFDGGSSIIREDGSQTGSGNVGTSDLNDFSLGYNAGDNERYWDGLIGFAELHDGEPSNGLATREQQVANMWDITI